MLPSDERRVYQGEEPELFRKIEHRYAERGSWVTIAGSVRIVRQVEQISGQGGIGSVVESIVDKVTGKE